MTAPLSSLRSLLPPLSVYTEDDDGPRHATWLELFFDLVFVVALARLGTALHHDLTLAGFGEFALLFFLLWWIWLSYSYAADLFGAEDTVSKFTFLAAMAVVLLVTQAIPEATGATSFEFAAGTFVLRFLLTASFFRVRHIPSERPFIALDALTTLVWGLSLLVEPPGRVGI